MSGQSPAPWYREPMVWMIISIPAVAVVVGITMLVLSIKHYDGLVSDDYYKEGMGINATIERSQNASLKEIKSTISMVPAEERVSVSLEGNASFDHPTEIVFNLRHSTRAGYDRELVLPLALDNRYSGKLPNLVDGKWYLELEADDWKISGQMQAPPGQNIIKLNAVD